jgi:hypothetical protein
VELVGAVGTPGGVIKSLTFYSHFLVIERGPFTLPPGTDFKLADNIYRRT